MEKTARNDKTRKGAAFAIIFYLLSFIFYLFTACENPGSPGLAVLVDQGGSGEPEQEPEPEPEAPPEPGLVLSVAVPLDITLSTVAESRVRIVPAQGGSAGAILIPVTGSFENRFTALSPGNYTLDVLLIEQGEWYTFQYEEEFAITAAGTAGAVQTLRITPNSLAFENDEETTGRTSAVTIRLTTGNSGGLAITGSGGGGAALTRAMTLPAAVMTGYFAVIRKPNQSIKLSGTDASGVIPVDSADGESAGASSSNWKNLYRIDASGVNGGAGGTMLFTLNVMEPGKEAITYDVTLKMPLATAFMAGLTRFADEHKIWHYKHIYVVGEPFDYASVTAALYYDGKSSNRIEVTDFEVVGFDSSVPGACQVTFAKNGLTVRDTSSIYTHYDPPSSTPVKYVTIDIVEQTPPRLFFDYGRRISAEDAVPGRYTVTAGRKLVIAPVLWRIPETAAISWSVSGGAANTAAKREFLTFNPGTPAGTYTATVTASFGGTTLSASTAVECVNGISASPSTLAGTRDHAMAPGDHGGIGGYGGYSITTHHIVNNTGYDIRITGNAFAGWIEPGIVWVMQDENNNGVADDTWYELTGSAPESAMTRRYAVTFRRMDGRDYQAWEDNLGNHGTFPSHWPDGAPGIITFTGTKISLDFPGAGSISGYEDTLYPVYDIDSAIHADGTPANLDHIDFTRVHTGEHVYTQLFGEKSTEPGIFSSASAWTGTFASTTAVTGGYQYRFVNKSGYEISVEIKDDPSSPYTVAAATTLADTVVTVTLPLNEHAYRYMGGNTACTVSGNTLTFEEKN